MGSNCPSHNAQPLGGKPKDMIRISAVNGSAIWFLWYIQTSKGSTNLSVPDLWEAFGEWYRATRKGGVEGNGGADPLPLLIVVGGGKRSRMSGIPLALAGRFRFAMRFKGRWVDFQGGGSGRKDLRRQVDRARIAKGRNEPIASSAIALGREIQGVDVPRQSGRGRDGLVDDDRRPPRTGTGRSRAGRSNHQGIGKAAGGG